MYVTQRIVLFCNILVYLRSFDSLGVLPTALGLFHHKTFVLYINFCELVVFFLKKDFSKSLQKCFESLCLSANVNSSPVH